MDELKLHTTLFSTQVTLICLFCKQDIVHMEDEQEQLSKRVERLRRKVRQIALCSTAVITYAKY